MLKPQRPESWLTGDLHGIANALEDERPCQDEEAEEEIEGCKCGGVERFGSGCESGAGQDRAERGSGGRDVGRPTVKAPRWAGRLVEQTPEPFPEAHREADRRSRAEACAERPEDDREDPAVLTHVTFDAKACDRDLPGGCPHYS